MKPYISIPEDQVTALLSEIVADEIALYVKTIKFHWDVASENFTGYYELFESQYKQLEAAIEKVSARINGPGSIPADTVDEIVEKSNLKNVSGKYSSHKDMIRELLDGHKTVIQGLKRCIEACGKRYNDIGTANFLSKLMDDHQSSAWRLRLYLK